MRLHGQLVRQLHLLGYLTQGYHRIETLASDLEVCSRTIRRDLEVFDLMGIELQKRYREEGGLAVSVRVGQCPICRRFAGHDGARMSDHAR